MIDPQYIPVLIVAGGGVALGVSILVAEMRRRAREPEDFSTMRPRHYDAAMKPLGHSAAMREDGSFSFSDAHKLKPDPATEASELFAKADAEGARPLGSAQRIAARIAAGRPRYLVEEFREADDRFHVIDNDTGQWVPEPSFGYGRRSSALRAARRLNAKEAAK